MKTILFYRFLFNKVINLIDYSMSSSKTFYSKQLNILKPNSQIISLHYNPISLDKGNSYELGEARDFKIRKYKKAC